MATKTALGRANSRQRMSGNAKQIKTILLQELVQQGFKDVKVISHSAHHQNQIILYVISRKFKGMSWSERSSLVWGILEKEADTESLKRIAYCFVWTPEESVPAFRK